MSSDVGQQHPLALYFWIWGLLFVISAGSYLIDFFQVGYDVGTMELRWALILVFMFLKAGYIVAVFMHLKWERLALIYALLLPPGVLMVLVGLMAWESDYTWLTRVVYFGAEVAPQPAPVEHVIH
ncbi:MAG: cytochrome C oxidase subunit IV family protein [Gammaproteobacteria bacterium]|nr:cytochrome C oxidase subunit IV family protein [Gammaproteobacteria bacterium]